MVPKMVPEAYYRQLASRNEPITVGKTAALVSVALHGAEIEARSEAEELLVLGHIRLIIKVALRFKGQGVDTEDLLQEAQMAFVRAVRAYDSDRGRFATYVGKAIDNALITLLRKENRSRGIYSDLKSAHSNDSSAYVNHNKRVELNDYRNSVVDKRVNSLNPVKRTAMFLSFGILGGRPMSHAEVASIVGDELTGGVATESSIGAAIRRTIKDLGHGIK